jgi:hypothetical protein
VRATKNPAILAPLKEPGAKEIRVRTAYFSELFNVAASRPAKSPRVLTGD